MGGDSENFNTRVRQLLLESLTHSLAGHHLETTIDLRCLGEYNVFEGRREGEGEAEFEDKSEKSSACHDVDFPLFPEVS